jgi:membrane protein
MALSRVFKGTVLEFVRVDYSTEAAALGFFLLFSMPPLTMLLSQLGSFLLENTGFEAATSRSLAEAFGVPLGGVDILIGNYSVWGGSFWLNIVCLGVLVYSATTVLTQLRVYLNRILGADEGVSAVSTVKDRFVSFASIFAFSLLLLLISLLRSLSSIFKMQISRVSWFPMLDSNIYMACLNLISAWLIFVLILKFMPDKRLKWVDVFAGASVTVVLFGVGKLLLDLYLQTLSLDSVYGAAGGVLVFMVWVYYSVQILFFGAVFTKHFEAARKTTA